MLMRICRGIKLITCAEKTLRVLSAVKTAVCVAVAVYAVCEGVSIAKQSCLKQ